MNSIYLIGSLRHNRTRAVAEGLRNEGYDVFDDWHAAGPEADDIWREYEQERGNDYLTALRGYHAQHVFDFDFRHITRCDIGVLVLPAGKSGHMELGYILGTGKPGFILLESEDPKRWDIMYRFATSVCGTYTDLLREIERYGA